MKGNGVEKNEALAVTWFQKAAAKKYGFAELELAEAYHFGRGVAQNNKEALRWYRNAAQHGPKGLVDESVIEELAASIKAEKKTAE